MKTFWALLLLLLLLFSQFRLVPADAGIPDTHTLPQETHIIYVRPRPGTELPSLPKQRESWYTCLLADVFNSTVTAKDRINHFYRHVATGFSASLTEQELERVTAQNWFVYSSPQAIHKRHTTRTGQFLGLHQELRGPVDVWERASYGEGMIIGVLDSGIDTEHPSFLDDGTLPPPPAKWKGACDLDATQGLCSNKIVGARSLVTPCRPPCNNYTFGYDDVGHGTLVASIAAGSPVKNASVYGQARGTAVGMAPRAHLAIYKVSRMDLDNDDDALTSDILAGIDAAVEDGVDVISMSLGVNQHSFSDDAIAIGALSAVAKGIPVIISAGNSGPSASSLENFAPWTLVVGASTIDRIISAVVKLGSGLQIEGQFHNQNKAQVGREMLPLVFKGSCLVEQEMKDVKGKVVLCEGEDPSSSYGQFVEIYHGAALVYMNPEETGSTISPGETKMDAGSYVTFSDGNKIKAYLNSTTNPTAAIVFKGTIIGTPRAPVVASFSSRGPNRLSRGIIKPDIVGPGVDIVVASKGQRVNPFFQVDGTSAACPHLSGIAALLKSLHPDWSPAAIMSAIMTSADVLDNKGDRIRDEKGLPAEVFVIGAGHVNVSRAADPGLVYNISHGEYVSYLCGLSSYTMAELQAITNNHTLDCSTMLSIREEDLNYPTISVPLRRWPYSDFAVSRTLTNVGEPNSVYQAEIDIPVGVLAVVKPQTLRFSKIYEQLLFSINFTVTAEAQSDSNYAQGEIKWVSSHSVVRSPISIRFDN